MELAELLAPLGLSLQTLADLPGHVDVVESETSFAENARRKAAQQARYLKAWVLGEDSGLVVDALDGAPGVCSARYAGPEATDEQNNRRLLQQLGETPLEQRTARYVCHMAVADPRGAVRVESSGECRGRIRMRPAGTAGFGYDPLFEIVEYHRTFGQLGGRVKRLISHRSRALRTLLPLLDRVREEG